MWKRLHYREIRNEMINNFVRNNNNGTQNQVLKVKSENHLKDKNLEFQQRKKFSNLKPLCPQK